MADRVENQKTWPLRHVQLCFKGIRPFSKQNGLIPDVRTMERLEDGSVQVGRYRLTAKYAESRRQFREEARKQLEQQGWSLSRGDSVTFEVWFYWSNPLMDWDGVGIIPDALKGIAYTDDCQIDSASVHFVDSRRHEITVGLTKRVQSSWVRKALANRRYNLRVQKCGGSGS